MGRYDVLANVALLAPKAHVDRIFDGIEVGADTESDCVVGVSRLPHDAGLLLKVLGMERHQAVQTKVRGFWSLVRQDVLGVSIRSPPLWG